MYAKLAFRNIRRSLRDYIIYFVTLTLTAALMGPSRILCNRKNAV